MRIIEQHKLINGLRDYVGKMSSSERYDFEMMQKRDKDDEELDQLAYAKLETLHRKYVVKKTKKDIEELFKKLSAGSNENKGDTE